MEWNLGAVVIAGPKALKATPNRVCISKVHSQGSSNGHRSFSFGEKEVGQGGTVAFPNMLYTPLPERHLVEGLS